MTVQVARIPPNACLSNQIILSTFCGEDNVSQENSHAQITRSTQTQLQRRLSIRKISASTKISVGSTQTILKRAEQLNITWPLPDDWDDQALALKFYPRADAQPSTKFQEPVWTDVHLELKKKGVTQQLLWEEYGQQYPNRCYSYSQFCARYADWRKKQKRSMRQNPSCR